MGLFSDYHDFFKLAAEKHVDILHTDEEQHFCVVSLGRSLFYNSIDLKEFEDSQRSGLETPCLILQVPRNRYRDNKADSLVKSPLGAFTILDKWDKSDDKFADRNEIWSETERIGEEILGYMREKLSKSSYARFRYFDFGSVTSEYVGPILDKYYGTRFDFTLELSANGNVYYQPAKFGE